jgi:hypothetical protein
LRSFNLNAGASGKRGQRDAVVDVGAAIEGQPGERAVERASVKIQIAKRVSNLLTDDGLA